MPSPAPKSFFYAVPGGVASLSGQALKELLAAVLDRDKSFRFQARGLSMHPFIRDGDLVTLSPLGGRRPGVGQVVACCHPQSGKLAVHRILGLKQGRYLIRGDNSLAADGLIPAPDVLGLVIGVERRGRHVAFGGGLGRIPLACLSRGGLLQPFLYLAGRLWCIVRTLVI